MGMMFLMSDSIVDANKPNVVMDDAANFTEEVEQDIRDRTIYANSIRLSVGYGKITSEVGTFKGVKHPGGLEVTLDYEHCWSSGLGIGVKMTWAGIFVGLACRNCKGTSTTKVPV